MSLYFKKWAWITTLMILLGTSGPDAVANGSEVSMGEATATAVIPTEVANVSPQLLAADNSDCSAEVTVHHRGVNGAILAADEALVGKVATGYKVQPATIAGYRLDRMIGAATGEFTTFPQEITYIYRLETKSQVTVRHLDQRGNRVTADQLVTGKRGHHYVTAPVRMAGYVIATLPKNQRGKFLVNQQTVTYRYCPVAQQTRKVQRRVVATQKVAGASSPVVDDKFTGYAGGEGPQPVKSVTTPTPPRTVKVVATKHMVTPQPKQKKTHAVIWLSVTLVGAIILSWLLGRKKK
ncbi:MucBP domain-containing protein [Levilactobacillus yonginensis]|uniref:MucBP domain-containing protein n=1 Tax=Levilactobacillus yonginensis TaxID=1054041 RepID=UPI00345D1F8E